MPSVLIKLNINMFNHYYHQYDQYKNSFIEYDINEKGELIYKVSYKKINIKKANSDEDFVLIEKPYELLSSIVIIDKDRIESETIITQDVISVILKIFYKSINDNHYNLIGFENYKDFLNRFVEINDMNLDFLMNVKDIDHQKKILSLLDTGIFTLEEIKKIVCMPEKCLFPE